MYERKEIAINSFPARCPYCDEVVEYGDLQPGENRIRCKHCQQEYIKIVDSPPKAPSADEEEK